MENPKPAESLPKKTPATRQAASEVAAATAAHPQNPSSTTPDPIGSQAKAGGVEGRDKDAKSPPPSVGSAAGVEATSAMSSEEPVTEIQKKFRRAERFGLSPLLSEEEKRNTRAERFGTGSGISGSKSIGGLEEQKKKARAERFGLIVEPLAEEEAKKKARLERFGGEKKLGALDEEKRKARAIRFSQSLNAPSPVSGQANSDLKATTVANS